MALESKYSAEGEKVHKKKELGNSELIPFIPLILINVFSKSLNSHTFCMILVNIKK